VVAGFRCVNQTGLTFRDAVDRSDVAGISGGVERGPFALLDGVRGWFAASNE
jgi:hypothetical protein